MTFRQVIEERQVFPGDDFELNDLDGYEFLFVVIIDLYNITVCQWRKVKWTIKKLEALCVTYQSVSERLLMVGIIAYSYEAVIKYKTCSIRIESALEKESTFQLLKSHEAMIDEEIKWEFIKQIEYFLELATYVPISALIIEQLVTFMLCKEKSIPGSLITPIFIVANFCVFVTIQCFFQYTFKAKYEEYRHHSESAMSDLESIALSQATVLVVSIVYYLLFDLTLLSFMNKI